VRLRLLDDARVKLSDWTPLHVHLGTAHRLAHAVRLDAPDDAISHGSLRVQLVFDVPIAASAGDRFVVRDAQAVRTIGGGVVLDPQAPARRRRSTARTAWLDAIERLLAGDGIGALLGQAAHGISTDALARLSGRAFDALALPVDARRVETGQGAFVFDAGRWNALRERALAALGDVHDIARRARHRQGTAASHRGGGVAHPDLAGRRRRMDRRRRYAAQRPVVASARSRRAHERTRSRACGKLAPRVAEGRFDPPWVRDLASALHAPEDEVRATLRKLAAQGRVHQVVRDLFYEDASLRDLARRARDRAARRQGRSRRVPRRDRHRPQARDPDPRIFRSCRPHASRA
jgi:selenocysteine-specific elongation factor